MQYWSQIGVFPTVSHPIEPFFSAQFSFLKDLDLRGYKKKGEALGGFVFPKNEMVETHAQLFSKYGLYINSNGVNLPGVLVRPMSQIGVYTSFLSTNLPVFAGDFLPTGEIVKSAFGIFDEELEVWTVSCVFGSLPAPLGAPPENLFFSQIVSSVDQIKSAVDLLVSAVTSPEGPVTFPNQTLFGQQMDAIKKQLEELQL